MDLDFYTLADRVRDARSLVVLTGAGMGLASGIPTFRGTDPDAIWSKDTTELGTDRYYRADPVGSWRWYRARFGALTEKVPNAGHHALAELESWHVQRHGSFLLVTQNVDILHEKAGSRRVVEVHGRADRVRCSRRGCTHAAPHGSLPASAFDWGPFDAAPDAAARSLIPTCPACGALLRAHVLWFDERYSDHDDYRFEEVLAAFRRADLILAVGTSFGVGVTAAALACRADVWTIDPGEGALPHEVMRVRAAQEDALPALVAALKAR